jgi:putative transposase
VRFAFIDVEKAHFPLTVLCAVMLVSRSGFYAWVRRAEMSSRIKRDAELRAAIVASHLRSGRRYGSPRVLRDLRADGERVSKKRVERLMRETGLRGRRKGRYRCTTDSKHGCTIAPNLLERNFSAAAPNQKWVSDVTAIATDDGFSYLATMIDLYSRRVVGWATSAINDTALALAALRKALNTRDVSVGLVHHSDRGSPYASDVYQRVLRQHGIVTSMSRKGDCWDNAVAESFFATLRAELVDGQRYTSRGAADAAIAEYIDNFYNLHRRHSSVDYLSPIEFELRNAYNKAA